MSCLSSADTDISEDLCDELRLGFWGHLDNSMYHTASEGELSVFPSSTSCIHILLTNGGYDCEWI